MTSVNGKFDAHDNVFGFWVENQQVNYFPRGIEKFLPNLKGISVDNSKLQSIRQSDLKPFKNLTVLSLPQNEIEILVDGLLAFNPELRIFYLYDNLKLKAVGENVIPIDKQLMEVYLSRCSCIDGHASKPEDLPNLLLKVQQNCMRPEQLREKLFGEEFSELEQKVLGAKNELNSLQASLDSCDGNLNAATKNMMIGPEAFRSFDIDANADNSRIVDLNCDTQTDYKCNVVGLKIPVAFMKIGKLNVNWNPYTLNSVTISKQQTLFLPTNFAGKFPALTELIIKYSGLSEIDGFVLMNMRKLQNLVLEGNKLQEILVNAFDHLIELENLDLSLNRIEHLEDEVFKNLDRLEVLNLNGNLLTSLKVDVVKSLVSLKTLNLRHNKLQFLSANLLSPLVKIEHFDLSDNICIDLSSPNATKEIIEEVIIKNCVLPVELNCSSEVGELKIELYDSGLCKVQGLTIHFPKTKISRVNLEHLTTNSKINSLHIVDQSMKFIPSKLSNEFPNLKNILIVRSKLSSLSKNDFEGFTTLKKIVINKNNLVSVEGGTFDGLSQLDILDLSFNQIVSLPPKIFHPLKHVKILILSSNQIEKFEADFLPPKNAIEDFKIDNNQLDLVETKVFRFLRRAKVIDFTRNVCINRLFQRTENSSRALLEFSAEIGLMCS